jgi:hypothetical protein
MWKTFCVSFFLLLPGFSAAQAVYTLGSPVTFFFIGGFTNTTGVTLFGTTIDDTLPTDATYVSCTGGACSDNSGLMVWNLGNVPPGATIPVSVSLVITTCATNAFVDQAAINITSPVTMLLSNPVTYTVNCSTNTPTNSPTITSAPTLTQTPTITSTPTDTSTVTSTPTQTSTPTVTFTSTMTLTPTITDTPTATFSPTVTFTPTNSYTPTNTFTVTLTPTITNTFTVTPTYTPTCVTHAWPDPYNPKYAVSELLNLSCIPPGATVSFYTVSGELVFSLPETGGMVQWDGRNRNGVLVSSGVYFYVIQVGNEAKGTGKFLVNRGP